MRKQQTYAACYPQRMRLDGPGAPAGGSLRSLAPNATCPITLKPVGGAVLPGGVGVEGQALLLTRACVAVRLPTGWCVAFWCCNHATLPLVPFCAHSC